MEQEKLEQMNDRIFYRHVLEEYVRSMNEERNRGVDITNIVLNILEELGFDRNKAGTRYLEEVISTLYYERKAFSKDNEYFNFDNERNNHYSFANEVYECGLINLVESIKNEKKSSKMNNSSLNDIIYFVTNNLITKQEKGKLLVYSRNNKYT